MTRLWGGLGISFPPSFYDGLADRLELALYDTKQELRERRLRGLLRELEPMKFRITEPVFWFGKQRAAGEIVEAPTAPYRIDPTGHRVAQFVEIPEANAPEIKMVDTPVTPPPVPVTPAKHSPLAARVRALTGRFAKFQDSAGAILGDGETAMNKLETDGPGILWRATQSMQDGVTAITDLGDALKSLDRTANGS